MKLKHFIILGILTTAALYIYLDKPLQKKLLGKIHQAAPELNKSTLYKWKNNKGEWQITDKPPQKGIAFTTITSQDQINVIPSPPKKNKR